MILIICTLAGLYFLYKMVYTSFPMKQTLYIIRGIPGSGKSTHAANLASTLGITSHFEADMYFVHDGVYQWKADEIGDAHCWCYDQFYLAIQRKQDVIVSNTFTRWREMREYVETALEHDYNVEIIECTGNFQSVHGVPAEALEKMRARMIPNSGLPQQMGITYRTHSPIAL